MELPLPLEHLSAITIATQLWKRLNIDLMGLRTVNEYREPVRFDSELAVKSVCRRATQLPPLPHSSQELLRFAITAVGIEIFMVASNFVFRKFSSDGLLSLHINDLRFTSLGTVDVERTLDSMPSNDPNYSRWQFGIRLLESKYILILWDDLRSFHDSFFFILPSPENRDYYELSNHFKMVMMGNEGNLKTTLVETIQSIRGKSLNLIFLEYAIRSRHNVVFEHLWEKLTEDEKQSNVMVFARLVATVNFKSGEDCHRILVVLLSAMEPDDQKQFLKKHGWDVVIQFLATFVRQRHLERILERKEVWDLMTLEKFDSIVSTLVDQICKMGYGNDWILMIFKRLWNEGSYEGKMYVINTCEWIPSFLSKAGSEEIVKLLFDFLSADEKRQYMYSEQGIWICQELINGEKKDIAERVLRVTLNIDQDQIRTFLSHL